MMYAKYHRFNTFTSIEILNFKFQILIKKRKKSPLHKKQRVKL